MMYYGVPLAVRDIKVNIYLSEALNALVELPTFVITPILLRKFNRRSSVLVNCLLGGALGVLCFMFPTCVRNFATTMLRQALVLGGACCPSLLQLEEMFRRSLSRFSGLLWPVSVYLFCSFLRPKGQVFVIHSKHKSIETKP
ncbi:unnamed protein product [Microthlaspi erraticum]|uniref:Uncharacterized protein n=1 Tax=Microthlaspi erraticum TaxID=1685480 RepID=A0A6D2KXX8_9BRAS|nr:unnamed protein product [Microthlaspi erraticum]